MKKTLAMTMILLAAWVSRAQSESPITNPVPAPTTPAEASLVNKVTNDEKEILLADSIGKTLYVFDIDEGSGTSKCIGDCAEVWPPYILTAGEVAKLKAPLGSVLRANRKPQLTIDGKPVYTYIFDRVSGDDKGDGIGGVWHYIEVEEQH